MIGINQGGERHQNRRRRYFPLPGCAQPDDQKHVCEERLVCNMAKRKNVKILAAAALAVSCMAGSAALASAEELTGEEYGEIGYSLKQSEDYDLAVKCFEMGIAAGDGESMLQLGECLTAGYTTVDEGEDLGETVKQLWLDAWDAGTTRGYFDLGLAYLYTTGLDIPGAGSGEVLGLDDPELGFDYLLQAGEANDGKAPRYVGICYENGYGVEQDYDKAAEWYIASDATYYLARFNLLGISMDQDIDTAIELFDTSARGTGGNRTESMNSKLILAELYYTGSYSEELYDGTVKTAEIEPDQALGIEYYQLAVADGNTDEEILSLVEEYEEAQYEDAVALVESGEMTEGLSILYSLAESGNEDALAYFGQ